MSKLKPEDIAWLEQRIGGAMQPVQPRDEFVRDAKMRVLAAAAEQAPADFVWTPASYAAIILAGLALVAAIVWRVLSLRTRRMAS